MHGIHCLYLSISGGLLGEVGDAIPELGHADAVSSYHSGVYDAEDDRHMD